MAVAENRPGVGQELDLSPLRQMVGVRNALGKLKREGGQLERGTVLGVLEAHQSTLAQTPGFDKKARTLRDIIDEIKEHEEIKVEAILGAVGVGEGKSNHKGFSLRGLLGRR